MSGSKPTARSRPESPAGEGRIEKRTPAAERRGESITRRIGLTKNGPTRKGADAILVSRPKGAVREANLKVKVGCEPERWLSKRS